MSLIYSFVARGTVVLSEYTKYSGNFNQVAVECLSRLSQNESRFTYRADDHLLNFLLDGGYTYLLVTEQGCPRETAFFFLDKIKKEFQERHADKSMNAIAHSLDRQFSPRLKHWMEYCDNNPAEISKVANVRSKVDEVKGIMIDNIEKVLQRGERIEILVDKTDNLRDQAQMFHRQGRQLRNKMWWQNMKIKILVCIVLLLLIVVIFCSVCFSGGNCLD